MICKNCEKSYDLSERIPKLLPNCGHSICKICLAGLKISFQNRIQCPFDQINYDPKLSFHDNLFLIEELKKSSNTFLICEICELHLKQKDLLCINCNNKVCSNCVLFGEHKGHQYDSLENQNQKFKENLQEYKKEFGKMNNFLENNFDQLKRDSQQVENQNKLIIREKFNILKNILLKQEENQIFTLNKIFQEQENKLKQFQQNLQKVLDLLNQIEKTENYSNLLQNNDLFKNLKEFWAKNEITKGKQFFEQIYSFEFEKLIKNISKKFCSLSNEKLIFKSDEEIDLINQDIQEVIKEGNTIQIISENQIEETNKTKNQKGTINKSILKNSNYIPTKFNCSISDIKSNNSIISQNSMNVTNKKCFTPNSVISNLSQNTNSCVSKKQVRFILENQQEENNKENQQNIINQKTKSRREIIQKVKIILEKTLVKNLTKLDLSRCELDDDIIKLYQKFFQQLKSVKVIKINHNLLTEYGLKYLLKSIKDLSIEYLFLTNNQLKETALDYLISFSKYNNSLKAVYFTHNPLTKNGKHLRQKTKILEQKNIVLVM